MTGLNAYETLLRPVAGERLRLDEPMHRYTVARLGGPADALVIADTPDLLETCARIAWREGWPLHILGGGANVLISDRGVRGLVLINHARGVQFHESGAVEAESGVILITLTRECIGRGLAGFEWAIGVPGTVGGATVNNAGAHGSDMAANLAWAEIARAERPTARFGLAELAYRYRESALKRHEPPFEMPSLVVRVGLHFAPGHTPAELAVKAEGFNAHRKRTQPPGASLGSMFKNPPGDYAGRLIEAAGLKGTAIGGVQISPVHANFFVNTGGGTADDYRRLIALAQEQVRTRFGVELELEIELIGN